MVSRIAVCVSVALLLMVASVGPAFDAGEQIKILSSDGQPSDNLGSAVSVIDRNLFAGCAMCDGNSSTSNSGAVYVFHDTSPDGSWTSIEERKITPSDPLNYFQFGYSIAASGRQLVAGAPGFAPEDYSWDIYLGCIYVFRDLSAEGDWSTHSEVKIIPSHQNPDKSTYAGSSVSISGRSVFVGAPGDNDVIVYQDTSANGDWSSYRETYIHPGDNPPDYPTTFGLSVSAPSERELFVGSPRDSDFGEESGAVYIYRDTSVDGDWTSYTELKLAGSDTDAWDRFGAALSAYDSTLTVGAPHKYANYHASGVVYILRDISPGGDWSSVAETTILPASASDFDRFGLSVALLDRRLLVGAPNSDLIADDAGMVLYVEDQSPDGSWSPAQSTELTAFDADSTDIFGWSVALDQATFAIGAPLDYNQNGIDAGCVYVMNGGGLMADGFESGDTSAWSATVP